MLSKPEAIALVNKLTKAAIRHYEAVNGIIRAKDAQRDEDKATLEVLKHLTSEPVSLDDIDYNT